jgi:phosphoribosylglycinamide formyltransferase-1
LTTRIAVLISGRGSNMEALVRAFHGRDGVGEVVLVVANRPDAAGLAYAGGQGIEAVCVDHKAYGRDRAAHERAIQDVLVARGVGLVCLAGYMRLLTPYLVEAWTGRMLNIHPSLLPAFPGLDTHGRALAAGCRVHGCTVHVVTDVMDEGPILAQAAVPVLPGDTASVLAARVLVQEHALYPLAVRAFVGGAVALPGADAALRNPDGMQHAQ